MENHEKWKIVTYTCHLNEFQTTREMNVINRTEKNMLSLKICDVSSICYSTLSENVIKIK